MPRLVYDRDRVTADIHNGGTMAKIAQRLQRWQTSDDDNGLALLRAIIEATPSGHNSLWRLDVEDVDLVVLAAFSCDENGSLTYNGELTLTMLIDGRFEISDTGLGALGDLADLTAQPDGQQRLFTLLDAITAHLNAILTQVLRFSRKEAQPRGILATRLPQPTPTLPAGVHLPTIAEIAAQIRRDIAFGGDTATASPPRIPPAAGFGANAEQLITARERTLGHSRGRFRLEVDELNRGWMKAGCPAIGVMSITPGAGSERDTEIVLSNGLRLLVNQTGVLLSDSCGRHLYFLDAINPEDGHDHLDLQLRPGA
ncbi:hypothetical protein ACW9HR_22305 [Nocardia gipuzkoensis]